ncbi:Ig-like domain-containing protein [Streptomyces sp. Isolate_219]|uniref:Ig-like domain-containing protein n=1 Tax=Streptomyces sp. Isolate_219 TaxID=2950110 RepID=UPI0021C81535|nr:Ig-like domain-containing protein [Streptomyces sp. Isolate_219]MCR8578141.1 Ig-like domain-containing protein [Streptomyces sp. Isolate_219]
MSRSLFPRRRPTRPLRVALAMVTVVGAGTLSACAGFAAPAPVGDPVKVALAAAGGTRTVQAGDKLKVTAEGGVLTEVTVTDPRGRRLPGGLGSGGTVWTSSAKIAPATKYSVVARTKSAEGGVGAAKESLTTARAARLNALVLDPGVQDGVVAVDRLLTLTFDQPVTDRAAVERRLSVTTNSRTTGSWDWAKDRNGMDQVTWRSTQRWKPGTEVTLRAELDGVDSGGGRYFTGDYDLNFTISRSCTDSDMGRVCGKVHVGDPAGVTASSVRGKDDHTTGIGDWNDG